MADQTVKVRVDNGSPERVAWDMVVFLRNLVEDSKDPKQRISNYLDLYAECLEATRGQRNFDPVGALVG